MTRHREPSSETLDLCMQAWANGQTWTISCGTMRGVRVRAGSAEEAVVAAVRQARPEELGYLARVKADRRMARYVPVEPLASRLAGYTVIALEVRA